MARHSGGASPVRIPRFPRNEPRRASAAPNARHSAERRAAGQPAARKRPGARLAQNRRPLRAMAAGRSDRRSGGESRSAVPLRKRAANLSLSGPPKSNCRPRMARGNSEAAAGTTSPGRLSARRSPRSRARLARSIGGASLFPRAAKARTVASHLYPPEPAADSRSPHRALLQVPCRHLSRRLQAWKDRGQRS